MRIKNVTAVLTFIHAHVWQRVYISRWCTPPFFAQGASGLFVALGLEVADAPAETPAKRPVGTPPRNELWAVTFPMVSKVTAGGFAETWGVTPGVRIIEVSTHGTDPDLSRLSNVRSHFYLCMICVGSV